jgi:L-asparaginase II
VQRAVLAAYEDVTGVASPGHAIDGCSAPNLATTLRGLATAMARYASAHDRSGARDRAMARLVEAMALHPDLVAGEGRACTELMRACPGVAIKTGAEGVFVAILPQQRLGVALKIADGATRGSEAAIAAILALMGVLDPAHPAALRRMRAPILTRRGERAGEVRAALA